MNNQTNKWMALICASAICFSLAVSHTMQGAQIESPVRPAPAAASGDGSFTQNIAPIESSVFRGMDWGLIVTIAASASAVLMVYNLLTARKHGWAWLIICGLSAVVGFTARIGASLFCEISSDATGISDWDSD